MARAIYGVVADLAVVKVEGAEQSARNIAAVASRPRSLTLAVSSAGRRLEPPSGFTQAVPGTLWMQRLALLLPTGWCMDALHRLVNFGYGPESAWPHALALAVGALLLGWLGTRLLRYQ